MRPTILIALLLVVLVGVAISHTTTKEGWRGGTTGVPHTPLDGMEDGSLSKALKSVDSAFSVNQDCPNVIMEVNGRIHLYNTRKAKVPGVNPIQLDSLASYPELMSYLNAKGMSCPALFLRQSRGATGELEMQQLVLDPQGHLVPIWGKGGLGAQSRFPMTQGFLIA